MWLQLAILAAAAAPSVFGGPNGSLRPLTRQGDSALAAGHYTDATRAYSEALELAPESYLLLYKRATAYMSQNQHSRALADFDKVLELTGDEFDKALFMKARLLAREGKWTEATKYATQYSQKNKGDSAAVDLVSRTLHHLTWWLTFIPALCRHRRPGCAPQCRKSGQEQTLGHLCCRIYSSTHDRLSQRLPP
jgi:tetratricopeptide (TPR) repeat protein